jgi:hypothetical protein
MKLEKQSEKGIKNSREELVQPAGIKKLKFEVGQEMGISSKAKNKNK